MTPLSLAEKILALTSALRDIPHAFGGALALAYYAEPRATVDIDLNVFVSVGRLPAVASPLRALGAVIDDATAELIRRDGQARVFWDETPVDLFFRYDRFHESAAAAVRTVPFGDSSVPILAPEHLIVCKVAFDRPKDWVDIDAMLDLGTAVDAAEILRWVARTTGDEDPRFERIAAVLRRP